MIGPEEKKDNSVLSVVDDKPNYPYGLRITLDPDTIKKLGLTEMPDVGSMMALMAQAEVIAVNKIDAPGDEEKYSVELQIQDLDVKGESKEKKASSMLYGSEY